ncbi:UDP-N-acetylglucosamine 2-epimerase [Solemya pervernicosa gill symbiont]|nr:UDP-N-acetylglucosamine 2-epimerase [Solemya pervernicosa gill symbiont]
MAPVMRALIDNNLKYRFITTGQHQETMTDILSNFELRGPDYSLHDGKDITSIPSMLLWIVKIIIKTIFNRREIFGGDKSGIVLVHGDTFSTLLGALMGRVAGLKVGHIESGLRSYHLLHPFPEEITRLITFRLSTHLFCPGEWAVNNVSQYKAEKINTFYNTLSDSLSYSHGFDKNIDIKVPNSQYAVATIHRVENIYSLSAITRIVSTIETIAQHIHIIFILHKTTENKLKRFGLYNSLNKNPNIEFRGRYDYFRFIKLISSADFVISDGGSNQEECSYLGIPVLLLRMATERQEGLGKNCLLSKFDDNAIQSFTKNYESYRIKADIPPKSPSSIIAEACKEFV